MKSIVVLSFVAFLTVGLQYCKGEDFVCQKDVPYIENECNSCVCTSTGGILACTQRACQEVDTTKLYNCKVGTSYEKGCNKCWCVQHHKSQGTICTNKEC